MAEQELHETDSNEQKDWQNDAANDAVEPAQNETVDGNAPTETPDNASDDAAAAEDDDDYGIDMEQVQAVLNATADKATLTPQMRRMMARQAENTKRVEESIKGTKSNPRWFVPLFCALMIIGLIWAVVYYLSPSGSWPIPNIGAWNLAIAFAIIMVGFLMTMWWR